LPRPACYSLPCGPLPPQKEISFTQSPAPVEACDFVEVVIAAVSPDARNPFTDVATVTVSAAIFRAATAGSGQRAFLRRTNLAALNWREYAGGASRKRQRRDVL